MSRILIRGGMNPLEKADITSVIARNLIGSNTGNLIYANSIYRALTIDENTEIVPDCYSLTEFDAPMINEEFDSYIIPLADMFRNQNETEINRVKGLVKALKIPCTVIGVGVRANSINEIDGGFAFDNNARSFIKAVLDKSAMIGVRGELTARYFTNLGFKEDRDFTVIGCPSMFTYGNLPKMKPLQLDEESLISVNLSIIANQKTIDFCRMILDEYKNSVFIPQRLDELRTLYLGSDYIHATARNNYPDTVLDSVYAENRVKIFLQADQWIKYLSDALLSIGPRLHGNIAGILAGTPSIIVPHGARMKELISYHSLPHIEASELSKCNTPEDVASKVDFDTMYKKHEENFERYKSFLKINSLENIYDREIAPYDKLLEKNENDYEVSSVINLSSYEVATRFSEVYDEKSKNLGEEYRKMFKRAIRLNNTSIKKDIKLLIKKIFDKLKKNKRSNTQRLDELNKL